MDVSDIFYFFLVGEGEGGVRGAGGGGDDFLLKIPGGGGGVPGVGRGREGVCGKSGNLERGGAKYFLGGRNVHQVGETLLRKSKL